MEVEIDGNDVEKNKSFQSEVNVLDISSLSDALMDNGNNEGLEILNGIKMLTVRKEELETELSQKKAVIQEYEKTLTLKTRKIQTLQDKCNDAVIKEENLSILLDEMKEERNKMIEENMTINNRLKETEKENMKLKNEIKRIRD